MVAKIFLRDHSSLHHAFFQYCQRAHRLSVSVPVHRPATRIITKGSLLGGETHWLIYSVCWKEVGQPFGPPTSYFSNMCSGGMYAWILTCQDLFCIAKRQERVIARRRPFGRLQTLPLLHHSSGGYPRYIRYLAHPLGICDGASLCSSSLFGT